MARKVLQGETRGYRNHPQLDRFRSQDDPVGLVDAYLLAVHDEAVKRGYKFQREKIGPRFSDLKITVTDGQLRFELLHLLKKLKERDPERYDEIGDETDPTPHPIFSVVSGGIEAWEIIR